MNKDYHYSKSVWSCTEENCVVELDSIKPYAHYYRCPTCKKVTGSSCLENWIDIQSSTCPHCRVQYKIIPILYQQPSNLNWRWISHYAYNYISNYMHNG